MKKIFLSLFFTVLSLFASDGEALSTKCVACHGAAFEKSALGKSAVVNGQSASDIYGKLIAYKQGTRNTEGMGALMKGQTASMSNHDLWGVAEYIVSLSEEATTEAAPAATEEVVPANDWPYACSSEELSSYITNRYFKVSASGKYPGIGADSKTIQIDHKNKTINVWTIWLASEQVRQSSIDKYGNSYNNYGYFKSLDIIDYRNMRSKTTSMTEYECNGNVINTFNDGNSWALAVPDSVMEGMIIKIMKKYKLK